MSDDVDVQSPRLRRRAEGYLRWYPAAWRERYGDEFVAHLEDELAEQPFSATRGLNIVVHGVTARLRMQRGLQWFTRLALVVLVVGALVTAALVLAGRYRAVTMTPYSMGVGVPTTPSRINDLSFTFKSVPHTQIRITQVAVVPLRGFLTPKVVGVLFADRPDSLSNYRDWPPRTPPGSTWSAAVLGMVPAYASPVTLGHVNTLLVGFRTATLHSAYAIAGLKLTYLRRGVSHTAVLSQGAAPDVLCVTSPQGAMSLSHWCSGEISAAHAVASDAVGVGVASWSAAQRTAATVADAAGWSMFASNQAATLGQVRHWATRLYPAGAPWGIRSVSALHLASPVYQFVINEGTSDAVITACVIPDVFNGATGSLASARVRPCPR